MPLLDEQKKQLFTEVAIQQGFDSSEVESFLGQAETADIDSVPFAPQRITQTQPLGERETFVKRALDIKSSEALPQFQDDFFEGELTEGRVIPNRVAVNTRFGVRSRADVFSRGINNGVDFNTKRGTPVALPEGEWIVREAFGGATREGFIGNGDNNGFGNSVLVVNQKTGESLRFSHLDRVGVKPGQRVTGGQVVALSGNTGNSSGPHLDVEFRNSRGFLQDVLRSRFRSSF